MNILLVEDDSVIASGLCYALETEGYSVIHCLNVAEAANAIKINAFDLAILDVTLPDGTGFDVCRCIKGRANTPVIFLTAVDDEVNTVMGLELGADDYITKPFRVRELLARIKVVLRRNGVETAANVSELSGGLRVDMAKGIVTKDGKEIMLSALEYRLLLTFLNNRGQILSRVQILDSLWDVGGNFVNDNTLSVYIKRLREKLGSESLITTLRGIGYRME